MKIITINTYDPASRFGMNDEQAKKFFKHVEQKALDEGYDVQFTKDLSVDQFSEDFVTKCFENYYF